MRLCLGEGRWKMARPGNQRNDFAHVTTFQEEDSEGARGRAFP